MPTIAHSSQPFTVRLIYFQPKDGPSPEVFDQNLEQTPAKSYVSDIGDPPTMPGVSKMMREVQQFFGIQMERHGLMFKTFTLETYPDCIVKAHHILGQHNTQHYVCTTTNSIKGELCQQKNDYFKPNNIYIMIVGGLDHVNNYDYGLINKHGIAHTNENISEYDAIATIAGNSPSLSLVVKHEVGHTFGLIHNERQDAIMYPQITNPECKKVLYKDEVLQLDRHRYFNHNPTSS